MQTHDMVLNLHGEVPNNQEANITELNAEEAFLPTLIALNQKFPEYQALPLHLVSIHCVWVSADACATSLRIVLEHCSTNAAVDAVRACTSSVSGASIIAPVHF